MVTPFYADSWLSVYGGDCREVLATLPAESVHCVVTSPPYWGLRDYGTAAWSGGEEGCDHVAQKKPPTVGSSSGLGYPADGGQRRIAEGNTYHEAYTAQFAHTCGKCGAVRQDNQLGLEPTPEEYVANLVTVFRAVRRVLRSDGTLWLNLGDSYGSGARTTQEPQSVANGDRRDLPVARGKQGFAKQLVGIPWRVAFALQAHGWYLRSAITWCKRAPMPESVTDRPTSATEMVFLLAKSPTYYYDAEAVSEPAETDPQRESVARGGFDGKTNALPGREAFRAVTPRRNMRNYWILGPSPYGSTRGEGDDPAYTLSPDCPVHSLRAIRRSLQTAGDDGLLDHLRSRSRRSGSRPVPAPDDELQPSFRLDSPASRHATTGSPPPGSSLTPTPQSTDESRTPARPSSGDGQAFDAGTGSHTSHSSAATTVEDPASESDAPSATGRSGHANRTTDESGPLDWASLEPSPDTPDRAALGDVPELGQRTPESSSAAGSAERDPDAQTTVDTSGTCTCIHNTASHFAVFPPKLVEPCIKAGTSERGVCAECGAPWRRVVNVAGPTARDRMRKLGPANYAMAQPTNPQGLHHAGGHGDNGDRVRTTAGWQPSCAHGRCPVCHNTGSANNDGRVSRVRQDLRTEGPSPAGDVLLQDLREQSDGADTADDEGLRDLGEGLPAPLSAWASDGDADGLSGGASAGDGDAAWPDADLRGSGRPHQRGQVGQPPGEPARDDQEGARRPVEPRPGTDGDVPRLRQPLPAQGTCGQCGANLEPIVVPATVLDVFAGSGTTGLVAQRLSRRAILIDLNPAYLAQQLERNAALPLGLAG